MRLYRGRFLVFCSIYALLVAACLTSLGMQGDLSLGRHPIANLQKTLAEMGRPSFLDAWFGDKHVVYRSDSGDVLRTENRQQSERDFLRAVWRALWVTIQIAALGTLLGSLLGLPLSMMVAKNLNAPPYLAWPAKLILDAGRSIHTLVFGLLFVGVIGLGPTAGILAIAAHSLGSFGKLYAEAFETLDMGPVDAIRGVGATPLQVFFLGVWPIVLPQMISINLYLWEYNTRDSTILGVIGAGGLGLLISEAISLFQWDRLTTLLLVVVAFVTVFDMMSRRIRQELL